MAIKNNVEEDKAYQNAYIDSFTDLVHSTLDKEVASYEIKEEANRFIRFTKNAETKCPIQSDFRQVCYTHHIQAKRDQEKLVAWKIYSIITDHFVPNPTRLRDWITTPKSTDTKPFISL